MGIKRHRQAPKGRQRSSALMNRGEMSPYERKPVSEPKAHTRTCSWKRLRKTRGRRLLRFDWFEIDLFKWSLFEGRTRQLQKIV
ncbi:hypothetical protein EVAR_84501_1 [Eumeta japonica]|uniref:Uncharacterized protein n=1 Tax=Eumeta variegata TaxID=151549 RepID=A0A4C1UHI4_EUMVA|nr:hypothetical protein EVAR_84501_1 [Eumeta japonica]